jgi:hypothetical protein
VAKGSHWRTSARPAIAAPIVNGRACSVTQFVRIQIADEAIKATLPLGTAAYEPEVNAKSDLIWVETHVVDKLTALRGPGENYSDVILRLVAAEGLG